MPDEKLPQELFRTVTKARHRFDPKRETSEKFRGKKKNTWFATFGCWFWPLATRPSPFGGKRSHSRFGAHLGRYILACTESGGGLPDLRAATETSADYFHADVVLWLVSSSFKLNSN